MPILVVAGIGIFVAVENAPGGAFRSKDATVHIDSPDGACWTANIGGATQQGCGSQDFPVHDDLGVFSSVAQKSTAGGQPLTIEIVQSGSVKAQNTTYADYGAVSVVLSR